MLLSRLTIDFVVHDSSYIVLEILSELVDCSLVSSLCHLTLQKIVALDDFLVSIGEVVFTP